MNELLAIVGKTIVDVDVIRDSSGFEVGYVLFLDSGENVEFVPRGNGDSYVRFDITKPRAAG